MDKFESAFEQHLNNNQIEGLVEMLSPVLKTDTTKFQAYLNETKASDSYNRDWDEQEKANWTTRLFIHQLAHGLLTGNYTWYDMLSIDSDLRYNEITKACQLSPPKDLLQYLKTLVRAKADRSILPFPLIKKLHDNGLLAFDDEVFAYSLVNMPKLFSQNIDLQRMVDIIRQDEATRNLALSLFEVEVGILRIGGLGKRYAWHSIFLELIAQTIFSKTQIAKAIFTAFNNPTLNKQSQSWMKSMLEHLDLTKAEESAFLSNFIQLINNEQGLLSAFALKRLKPHTSSPDFDWKAFLMAFEGLAHREKSTGSIKAGLQILIKQVKKDKTLLESVCLAASNVFIHEDEKLQSLVLELFKQLNQPTKTLTNAVNTYEVSILKSIKKELFQVLGIAIEESKAESILYEFDFKPEKKLTEINSLKYIRDWDDFVFTAGKVLKGDNIEQMELFLEAMLHFNLHLQDNNKADLAAAVKQAKKVLNQRWLDINKNTGHTNLLLNRLFYYWYNEEWSLYDNYSEKKLQHLNPENNNRNAWYKRFDDIKERLKNKSKLPILSTPTHAKWWIDPVVLLARLKEYQAHNEEIDEMDFAIAISRTVFEESESSITIEGIHASILKYLLSGQLNSKLVARDHLSLWLTAAYTRNDRSGLKSLAIAFPKLMNDNLVYPHTVFTAKRAEDSPEETYIDIEVNFGIFARPDHLNVYHSYAHLERSYYNNSGEVNYVTADRFEYDVEKMISLTPHYLEPYFGFMLKWNSLYAYSFPEVREIRPIQRTLHVLQDYSIVLDDLGTMFLASSLVFKDKTVAASALELLYKQLDSQSLQLELFARSLAQLVCAEICPTKRLNDQLIAIRSMLPNSNILIVSTIESIFDNLYDNHLPKGIKKLLELYFDVLFELDAKPSQKMLIKFRLFEKMASVKSIIKKLLKMV